MEIVKRQYAELPNVLRGRGGQERQIEKKKVIVTNVRSKQCSRDTENQELDGICKSHVMTTYLELVGLFVLLMLPFLYETSHIFRYYFKFLLYYGIVSFNSIILIPCFLLRPCDIRNLL